MGLELVELVMELEDVFQISIADRDAERLETIGQTVDYVYQRLLDRNVKIDRTTCPTQHAFYTIRAGLMKEMGVARNAVRPDVLIGSLLQSRGQRRAWPRFARRRGLRVPRFSFATKNRFPNPNDSLRHLCQEMVERDWSHAIDNDSETALQAVFERVCEVVSEQLGVKKTELRFETHYVKDLRI